MSSEQPHSPTQPHNPVAPPVVPPLTGPGRLGIPISDDSSEDEASQIRALAEEKLSFEEDQEKEEDLDYHEEVVVSPKNESDDDIPLRRFKPTYQTIREREQQQAINKLNESIGTSSPFIQPRMERRQSVRFDVPSSVNEEQHRQLNSPRFSPETLAYIRALENPIAACREMEFEDVDEGEPAARSPLGSPPAYTSGDESTSKQGTTSSAGSNNNTRASRMEEETDNTTEDSDSDDGLHRRIDENSYYSEDEIAILTYITSYTPNSMELQPQLRPFSIEYIAAMGDVDLFIKVPRPDEIDDNVGLTQLDEPPSNQSDATIVDMQIRNAAKDMASLDDEVPVKLLENADEKPDEIKKWIADIKEFHKTKPSQIVHYKTQMPDIETLMQEWTPKMEDTLIVPSSKLDVSLEKYVDICLNIFDIPVGSSRIEGLHNLFSTLNTFNESQHFRNLAVNNKLGGETGETMDRLELDS